jgi:hypothetical protein
MVGFGSQTFKLPKKVDKDKDKEKPKESTAATSKDPKPEPPSLEPSKLEAPKPEPSKPEPPKPELSKPVVSTSPRSEDPKASPSKSPFKPSFPSELPKLSSSKMSTQDFPFSVFLSLATKKIPVASSETPTHDFPFSAFLSLVTKKPPVATPVLSTVAFSPPLRPISSATSQRTQSPMSPHPLPEPAPTPMPLPGFSLHTSVATLVMTGTSMVTRISSHRVSATINPTEIATPISLPGKHHLSSTQIGLIVTIATISGLMFLVGLGFFLRSYLRRRKEAHHQKTSRFWRGLFDRSRPQDPAIPLSDIPRAAPPCHPFPPTFGSPYSDNQPAPPYAPGSFKSRFSSLEAAVGSTAGTGASHKITEFFGSKSNGTRQTNREKAKGDPNTAAFSSDLNFTDAELGLSNGQPSEFVEVCLGEDVALEEEEKADQKRLTLMPGWDTLRRSMSPFPKPASQGAVKFPLHNEVASESSRWS